MASKKSVASVKPLTRKLIQIIRPPSHHLDALIEKFTAHVDAAHFASARFVCELYLKPPFQTAYQNNPYPFAAFLQSPENVLGSLYNPTDSYGNFIFTASNSRGAGQAVNPADIIDKTLEFAEIAADVLGNKNLAAQISQFDRMLIATEAMKELRQGNLDGALANLLSAVAATAALKPFIAIAESACKSPIACATMGATVVFIGINVSGQAETVVKQVVSAPTNSRYDPFAPLPTMNSSP